MAQLRPPDFLGVAAQGQGTDIDSLTLTLDIDVPKDTFLVMIAVFPDRAVQGLFPPDNDIMFSGVFPYGRFPVINVIDPLGDNSFNYYKGQNIGYNNYSMPVGPLETWEIEFWRRASYNNNGLADGGVANWPSILHSITFSTSRKDFTAGDTIDLAFYDSLSGANDIGFDLLNGPFSMYWIGVTLLAFDQAAYLSFDAIDGRALEVRSTDPDNISGSYWMATNAAPLIAKGAAMVLPYPTDADAYTVDDPGSTAPASRCVDCGYILIAAPTMNKAPGDATNAWTWTNDPGWTEVATIYSGTWSTHKILPAKGDSTGDGASSAWSLGPGAADASGNVYDLTREPVVPTDTVNFYIGSTTVAGTLQDLIYNAAGIGYLYNASFTYTLWVYGTHGNRTGWSTLISVNNSTFANEVTMVAAATPAGSPGWFSRDITALLASQADMNGLRVRLKTLTIAGSSPTESVINQVYVEVNSNRDDLNVGPLIARYFVLTTDTDTPTQVYPGGSWGSAIADATVPFKNKKMLTVPMIAFSKFSRVIGGVVLAPEAAATAPPSPPVQNNPGLLGSGSVKP